MIAMKENTVDMELTGEDGEDSNRECRMSVELYQNARQTMGELRDLMRETGMSWDFIEHQIGEANRKPSALDKALRQMDDYTTGAGKTLRDKPKNVW